MGGSCHCRYCAEAESEPDVPSLEALNAVMRIRGLGDKAIDSRFHASNTSRQHLTPKPSLVR